MLGLTLSTLISRVITLVVALTVHEFSHGYVAHLYGDETAADAGRLTLNPLVHLDVLGSLMLIVAGFGWARPTPIDPYTLNRKSRFAIPVVSLAGPASNLLLAVLAALPLRFGLVGFSGMNSTTIPTLGEFLIEFIIINISLFLFNLIPVSPLDGEKIIYGFLPPSGTRFMDMLRPYGSLILFGLIMLGNFGKINILSAIINPPLMAIFYALIGR
jgi:Zn-dependent protease